MSTFNSSSNEGVFNQLGNLSQNERVTSNYQGYFNPNPTNYLNQEINDSEAKEKGTEEQCNSPQPPKNKKLNPEELAKLETGSEIRSIYRHRIDRQKVKDKKSDVGSMLVDPWPVRQDVQRIQQEFHDIANANLERGEEKKRSLEVAYKFDRIQKRRNEHSTTAGNPHSDHMVNNLSLYLKKDFWEKLMKQVSSDLGNGGSVRSLSLDSDYNDLKNQVYDKGNNQVGIEDFQGLPEELQKNDRKQVPSYLELIKSRIEKDRGKVTPFIQESAQILVCAAVKEMEDFSVEKLDLQTLKKWGATLKRAKEVGFQVGFADDLLEKNLLAYFANKQILGRD